MRLVFVTQRVDAEDPVLGAAVAKLHALARRVEALHVLCLDRGEHDLPPNVEVVSFAAATRPRRGLAYETVLARALRRRPDALLAHMCPIYLVLAAPLAKSLRMPLLLWYTHWAETRTLRLATRLADAVLSVDRRSFPLPTDRLHAIGHGIDTQVFTPRDDGPRRNRALRLISLGRTAPTKGIATVVDGVELFLERGGDATLELRGAATTEPERAFRGVLAERIEQQGLSRHVLLEPPLPRSAVPALLRGADALVNAHMGTLDKVVYEASACAVPVVVSEPGFDSLVDALPIPLRFRPADPVDLANKLHALAQADPAVRAETGGVLRRRVEDGHSVETWADGVVGVVRRLRQHGPALDS